LRAVFAFAVFATNCFPAFDPATFFLSVAAFSADDSASHAFFGR
jgi:hypothetical protein